MQAELPGCTVYLCMVYQQCILCAGEAESIKWLSKHLDGKVLQGSYIAKLPTIKLTLAAAGYADGLNAASFSWGSSTMYLGVS